jgi:hypothetical protein
VHREDAILSVFIQGMIIGEQEDDGFELKLDSRSEAGMRFGIRAVTEGRTPGGITNCTPCE